MDPIEKYPRQASFIIDNLQWRISNNELVPTILPTLGDDFPRSFMFVRRAAGTRINFRLTFPLVKNESRLRMKIYMRLVNKDPRKSQIWEIEKEVERNEFIYTLGMEVGEIMDLENGWLIDGDLVFECGAYMKAILGKDGIWIFNFEDPVVYDYENSNDWLFFNNEEKMGFYSYKQPPIFHSPYIGSATVDDDYCFGNDFVLLDVESCLQLVHGVRMVFEESKLKSIIPIARSMKLYNVVHYCQYQLMTFEESVENLKFAFEFNTRHYSIHLMKKLKSRKELKEILEGMDIQKMSGESMKQCARFIFDAKI